MTTETTTAVLVCSVVEGSPTWPYARRCTEPATHMTYLDGTKGVACDRHAVEAEAAGLGLDRLVRCPECGPQEAVGSGVTGGSDPWSTDVLACGHEVLDMCVPGMEPGILSYTAPRKRTTWGYEDGTPEDGPRTLRADPSYQDACVAAADAQGVAEIASALRAHSVPCRVEQTGGMTMVAFVDLADGSVVGLTMDTTGCEDGDGVLLVHYETEDAVYGEGEQLSSHDGLTLAEACEWFEQAPARPVGRSRHAEVRASTPL